MVEGPLLSVVVPFYNVQDYIRDCLESLRVQTLTDLEVIMVDDGSPDGSLQVAEEYAARDSRFRVVRQENQGLGPARNTGTAHATGRYLTFVDSDDLVAPRAYSQLVGSLEETGSALAGGNAYRFSAAKGVYQSWAHRQPFATTRLATGIDAFPDLIRDRMIWNKVYRRSFWDEQGFAFPAIRYEDYPVTLPAYLRAGSVDVLSEHVYFWRDRESGDSITQQTLRLDNVRDRVTSALLVLDGLDAAGDHEVVRDRVHGYFIDVDVVALAGALEHAAEGDRPELEQLATTLADRLDPASGRHATRLARLVHRALRDRDIDLVRALARWRDGSGTKRLVAELARRPGGLARMLPALDAVVQRRKPQHPLRPRRLNSRLVTAGWEGESLHLQVDSKLRPALASRAAARARLRHGKLRIDLPCRVAPSGGGVRWEIDVTPEALDRVPASSNGPLLELTVALGPLRWRGWVRFEPRDLPGAGQTSSDDTYQLRGEGWYLHLARLADPVLARADVDEAGILTLTLDTEPADGDRVVIERPRPTPELVLGGTGRSRAVAAADVVADDPADNPVTGVAERRVRLRGADGQDRPVHLLGGRATADLPDGSVTLDLGWDGTLVVRQERRRA